MEKSSVQSVFDSAASNYDVMNTMMSLGMHRHWKSAAVDHATLYPGDRVLDLAAGTCDITHALYQKFPGAIEIIAADPNVAMLQRGRDRLVDEGIVSNISFCHCFAESLPFKEASFDLVICAFGFRNFSDKSAALLQIKRVLKPGGQCIILEFSHAQSAIMRSAYYCHAHFAIPAMCQLAGSCQDDYDYLVDSIARHPNQEQVVHMLEDAGFVHCSFRNLLSGVVSIHKALRAL